MPDGLLRRWIEPEPAAAPEGFRAAVGGHPLTAEILYRRGIRTIEAARAFLDPAAYTPAPPEAMPGMQAAAERVERAIRAGESICVWGDFDVDGQTSTTILVEALRALGAKVSYHIPVRAGEGHGVNVPRLARILDEGVTLVVTCDTGITAHDAIDYANGRGVDVVVTDHHEIGEAGLPGACAVTTPRLLPPGHPLAGLPGAGVAYLLAALLLTRAGKAAAARPLLELAALGIVADVAVQALDTRWLLQRGLACLRETTRPGLLAMMESASLNPTWLTEEHAAFLLAPRLNALGRLDDANPSVEFFTTTDAGRARVLATHLEGLNIQRRRSTGEVLKSALAQIERDRGLLDGAALVLHHAEWPAGVVGIVASELAERFNRPVVLLNSGGELARGSARSVEGVNITAAITQCAALLVSYGGHPMAAGMALAPAKIPFFRRALNRAVEAQLEGREVETKPALALAGEVTLADFNSDFIADLERLAPFGAGNPAPVLLARNVKVDSIALVGREGEHAQLIVSDEQGDTQRVIWWRGADWLDALPLPSDGRIDLACVVRASTYRGQRGVQVEFIDARPVTDEAVAPRREMDVIDQRGSEHPAMLLVELLKEGPCAVWAEADGAKLPGACDRAHLPEAETLVIFTTPPGRAELQAALDRVKARRVVLIGVVPKDAGADGFLKRLAGLGKYAIDAMGGEVDISRLAGACAAREAAVRAGLAWLERAGVLAVERSEDGSRVRLAPGGGQKREGVDAALAQLEAVLEETRGYREFFATAEKDSIVS